MNATQQYIDLYQQAFHLISQHSCPVMNAPRQAAFDTFQQLGLPSKKVERYRYAEAETAFTPNYGIPFAPLKVKPSPHIYNIKDASIDVSPYYAHIANPQDPIVALNTALAHDALLIHVPQSTHVDTPIVVDNWLSGSAPTMVNRRLLILMEQDSQATIIINDRADQPIQAMATQVTEVICHDGAHLDLYEVEETTPTCSRFAGTYISEGRDCTVHHTSVTLSGGHTRNTVDVTLNGEHSDVTLNGCAIANGTQRVDCNTLIHHRVPHCRSNQLYKYVVDNHAVGAFAGKILVDSGATATTSTETNANLLASSQARMFAQPMLEIYADDVQCSHGSTTGVMDESALLYMRQRGIPESQARTLLKNAFMGQVIDQVQHEPLRQKLYVKVEKRFQGENQKCEECRLCQTN